MGLFSNKKKHYVSTVVSRVLPDKGLPNSVKSAVTSNIFNEGDQLVERVLDGFRTSIGLRAEQMYRYGQKGYVFGLPKSTLYDPETGVKSNVAAALRERFADQSIDVKYAAFGAPNLQHMVWLKLYQQYRYNQATNLLTYQGASAYLDRFTIFITPSFAQDAPARTLEQWGMPSNLGWMPRRPYSLTDISDAGIPTNHIPIQVDNQAAENYALVSIALAPSGRAYQTFTIPLNDLDFSKDFYQAQYTRSSASQEVFGEYWSYALGEGTYPVLDSAFDPELDELGSFFPIGYFRFNKTDCLGSPNSTEYKTSKKLMKLIGMDYQQVAEAIHENPNAKDVEMATLMLAVPAQTNDPHEIRYLFDFFSRMYFKTGGDTLTVVDSEDGSSSAAYALQDRPQYGYVIQDARSKIAISVEGLIRVTRPGVIGSKGAYTHAYQTVPVHYPGGFTQYLSAHIYRHQVTESVCEEIQVINLSMKYWVWGSYATLADETDAILMIPLDHSITEDYPVPFKEVLYARSLHYFYHSHQVVTIKWYQTGFFQFLMIVIAVVITIVTCGADGGSSLAAALSAAGSWAAVWAILEPILIRMVIGMVAAKLFVKILGEEAAFLLALVAACYGMYNNISIPYVGDMLNVSTSLLSEVASSYQDQLAGLAKEYQEFQSFAEEKFKLLEDAQELLEQDSTLSPMVFLGEPPTDYYNRTVHSGNVGARSLDALTYYVDTMLRLPDFNDTMA